MKREPTRPSPWSRRQFIERGAIVTASAFVTPPLHFVRLGRTAEPIPPITDPRLKPLTQIGLDAAKQLGVTYADVRISHERARAYGSVAGWFGPSEQESMAVGVRVLVDGYWGFASSATWSPDEMSRLANEAVQIARANRIQRSGYVELVGTPPVIDGHWEMPVEVDPFDVSDAEVIDFLNGLKIYSTSLPDVQPDAIAGASFVVQNKAFASTDGSFCSQRVFRTSGSFGVSVINKNNRTGKAILDTLTPAGMGWELIRNQSTFDAIRERVECVRRDLTLPVKPVDVGRYEVVCDAFSMANFVGQTLGAATELDRILGFEANAGGTSYITDPLKMRGTLDIGNPVLNVDATRTMVGGVATVGWDDDGVRSGTFPLITNGKLADLQTTREGAHWLRNGLDTQVPISSNGCSYAQSAMDPQITSTANLFVKSEQPQESFEDLVGQMSKGLAFRYVFLNMDYQKRSGLGIGMAYEVKNGKCVAQINGAGLLFSTLELWKNLMRVGGLRQRFGIQTTKGDNIQNTYHSVSAVPAAFKEVVVIDVRKKA